MAGRVPVGEGHAGATPAEHRRVGGHGQVVEAQSGEHALDVEADPIADDLDGSARVLDDPHEVDERTVQRQGVDDGVERRRVTRQDVHVPGRQLTRALAALVVELVHAPHRGLVGHEIPQQGVADILEADRYRRSR